MSWLPLDWQYAECPSSASDAVLCTVLVCNMWVIKKCPNYTHDRTSLIKISILRFPSSYLITILIFWYYNKFNLISNIQILSSVINFIIQKKKLIGLLFKKSMYQTL